MSESIEAGWIVGPFFDPTNPLHRETAARQLRRREYADALKVILATVGDPTLRAVVDLHEPHDVPGWARGRECHGCPSSCCFGPEPWPCSTVVLIGERLGLPEVSE